MKTFVTSDLHFGHTNILKYNADTRKYKDVVHMNAMMIREWNESVDNDDLVYILGDVAFCNVRDAVAIMQQLAGRKILVKGNHDSKLVQDSKFVACFESIHDYLTLNYSSDAVGKVRVAMFHYPIFDHDQAGRGSIMMHGHRHGNPTNIPGRIIDVGVDATGKVVSLMDDIIKEVINKTPMIHHR